MLHESICILWWIQNTKNSWGVGPGMLNVCILLSIGSYGWELNWWKEWSERVTLYSENVIMQFSKIDGENNYLFPLLHLCILSCWMEQLFLDSKWCTDLASNESSHAIETNSSQRLFGIYIWGEVPNLGNVQIQVWKSHNIFCFVGWIACERVGTWTARRLILTARTIKVQSTAYLCM